MKKTLLLSLICASTLLSGEIVTKKNILPTTSLSIDTGGIIPTIDAYSDGVGVVVSDNFDSIDNSALNNLVFKYGSEAKENGISVLDQVLISPQATSKDLNLATSLTEDGSSCNDNNTLTDGETWLNGVCQGGSILNGTTCNDNNVQTINDVYTSGICSGKLTETPSCSDNTMTWNVSTKLCEKGENLTYTATSGQIIYTACPANAGYYVSEMNLWILFNTYSTTCRYGRDQGRGNYSYYTYNRPYTTSYTCPSGGTLSGATCTLNTLVTTQPTCQIGYTYNNTLAKCVQN